jgi:putative methyltransferase (TIGR04325 family)
LDFGGGLGSSYFQCRSWLNNLATLSWRVVEQPNYVKLGRAQLADQVLSFFDCIDKSTAGHSPNVAIFSGVLQYLPDPSSILARIAEIGIRHIIIDRTPIISGKRNILAVQVVPVRILDSSYPVRLFSRQSVLQPLEGKYRVMAEFPAVDGMLGGLRRRVEFRGFILEKKFV